jgi:hypothetical protein
MPGRTATAELCPAKPRAPIHALPAKPDRAPAGRTPSWTRPALPAKPKPDRRQTSPDRATPCQARFGPACPARCCRIPSRHALPGRALPSFACRAAPHITSPCNYPAQPCPASPCLPRFARPRVCLPKDRHRHAAPAQFRLATSRVTSPDPSPPRLPRLSPAPIRAARSRLDTPACHAQTNTASTRQIAPRTPRLPGQCHPCRALPFLAERTAPASPCSPDPRTSHAVPFSTPPAQPTTPRQWRAMPCRAKPRLACRTIRARCFPAQQGSRRLARPCLPYLARRRPTRSRHATNSR